MGRTGTVNTMTGFGEVEGAEAGVKKDSQLLENGMLEKYNSLHPKRNIYEASDTPEVRNWEEAPQKAKGKARKQWQNQQGILPQGGICSRTPVTAETVPTMTQAALDKWWVPLNYLLSEWINENHTSGQAI